MSFYPGAFYWHTALEDRLAGVRAIYSAGYSAQRSSALQLSRLNGSWSFSLRTSELARLISREFDLPDNFENWQHFQSTVPVMDKAVLRPLIDSCSNPGQFSWMATGGTSASPFRFPVLSEESIEARLNMAWYRQQFGVDYRCAGYLLWGHSHLLGTGAAGVWNRFKRTINDGLMGYRRFSAYDLSDAAMRRAGDEVINTKPDYFIGYARAIERFVSVNQDRAESFSKLRLVQPSGESFSSLQAKGEVCSFFNAPVRMEYGAVETGPIAYESDSGFDPLWHSHRLEVGEGNELLVSSLYPRAMPLLRYRLGDCCAAVDPNRRISEIVGRTNDFIEVNGQQIHSELISHAVRQLPDITGYQVRVEESGKLGLFLETENDLSDHARAQLIAGLNRVHPGLGSMSLRRVPKIAANAAGKRSMVVRVKGNTSASDSTAG